MRGIVRREIGGGKVRGKGREGKRVVSERGRRRRSKRARTRGLMERQKRFYTNITMNSMISVLSHGLPDSLHAGLLADVSQTIDISSSESDSARVFSVV